MTSTCIVQPGLSRLIRIQLLCVAVASIVLFCAGAMADTDAGLENLASGDVIVLRNSYTPPRNAAVGTILQEKDEVAISGVIGTRPRTCRVYKTMRVNGTPVPGLEKTYSTNVQGIGVRFYSTQGWGGGWERGPVDTNYLVPPNARSTFRISAELVITGSVGAGVLTSLPSLDIGMDDCYGSNLRYHITLSTGAQIVAGSCLVTTPSVSATLPVVTTRTFAGVGSTSGATRLRIGLNCNAGAEVYITLTDSTNPGNRTTQLTPAAGSTAGGLAMRLLYNGAPIAYGPDSAVAGNINQWRVGASSSLTEVPLTAEYIATGAVTPGEIKGIATFTMSYQ
ncbi:fimbrial protein [Pseudomonas guariconensis]|uniref:fimbrial protein n=2 Tax=Pseudomonas guariconensis TaxID=1288410 RepID=UPI0018AB3DB0|nr:fimbrial protein [Pseudomonas guariconensis]MBF8749799.1 type 1 fimbrial protein [Pseudomonas guariconensis]